MKKRKFQSGGLVPPDMTSPSPGRAMGTTYNPAPMPAPALKPDDPEEIYQQQQAAMPSKPAAPQSINFPGMPPGQSYIPSRGSGVLDLPIPGGLPKTVSPAETAAIQAERAKKAQLNPGATGPVDRKALEALLSKQAAAVAAQANAPYNPGQGQFGPTGPGGLPLYRGARGATPEPVPTSNRVSRVSPAVAKTVMKRGGPENTYAKGGSVRGSGIAQRGVKKCKVY